MEGFIKINEWLTPFSWIYGLVVKARNQLFELGVLKSHAFMTPVIAVGNITVGGAGKTPHVEYLIRLLRKDWKVAVLSRGYKRKSHGFVLADENTPMSHIGDEPFQMKRKFSDVKVAVDRNRCHGINMLTDNDSRDSGTDVIVLDDAYQHRYVKPGVNILLVDYHRPILNDKLLPAGRLREPHQGKDRADIVVITKCPADLKPIDYRVMKNAMNLFPYQDLFFSTTDYCDLSPLFGGKEKQLDTINGCNVLLLTGIASPQQMENDMKARGAKVTPLTYPDHHQFSRRDIRRINDTFEAMSEPKIIITTEKDGSRLTDAEGLSDNVRKHLYQLPIRVRIMLGQEEEFNKKITGYVAKNSRSRIATQGKGKEKQKTHNPKTIKF